MYPYLFIVLICPWYCLGTPIAQMVWEQGGMNASSESRHESTRDARNGWIAEPKGRGTWSILLSCLMTLSICAWTAYHPNIPKGSRSIWSKFSKRVKWLFMATLFPEAIVYCALAQLMAAKQLQFEVNKIGEHAAYGTKSTNHITPPHRCTYAPGECGYEKQGDFNPSKVASAKTWPAHKHIDSQETGRKDSKSSFRPWSVRQAFFANAGGLAVDSSSFHPHKRLAFTRHGILELAKAGILPSFNDDLMEDKSRADVFTKCFVCLQAGWFVAQFVGRTAQSLPVTLLELHTICHVMCAAIIYGLWWYKPYDVIHPLIIEDQRAADMAAFFGQEPSLMLDASGEHECSNDRLLTAEMVRSAHLLPLGKSIGYRSMVYEMLCEIFGSHIGEIYLEPTMENAVVDKMKISRQVEMANRAIHRLRSHNLHIRFHVVSSKILGQHVSFGDPYVTDEASNLFESHSLGRDSGSTNSRFAKFYRYKLGLFAILFTLYGAFHLAAWNYPFPTPAEMWLWRGSTLALASSPLICIACALSTAAFAASWEAALDAKEEGSKLLRFLWGLSLTVTIIIGFVMSGLAMIPVFLWAPARLILLGESFASLRSCVVEVYATTAWSQFMPHIG